MKLLEDRIRKDGVVLPGDVLTVGSFLNQQMDVPFLSQVCEEFYRLFKDEGITRIVTIEASGIGLACLTAQYFGVPVVFAKKSKSSNIRGDVYEAELVSYTRQTSVTACISKDLLGKDDRILLIDDFLAVGGALDALLAIARQAVLPLSAPVLRSRRLIRAAATV